MKIRDIQPATAEQWNNFAGHCDHATYFHTLEWAELWHRYTKGSLKPAAQLISFNDGLQAILPMSATTEVKGLVQQYTSSATGKYGGWLSDRPLTKLHAETLWTYASGLNILLRQNPYDPTLKVLDVNWSKIDSTQALDLSPGFEKIVERWTKGHYSAAQKSRRDGVQTSTASTEADWNKYFEVYLNSLERWGSAAQSRYDRMLFGDLFYQGSSRVKLWLAKYQGTIISGAICFYHNKHVAFWHGASLESFFKLKPAHLLQYEIIRDACNQGYRWYDFNPSGGLAGVVAFKKGFGCQTLASNLYIHDTQAARSLRRLSKLVRR